MGTRATDRSEDKPTMWLKLAPTDYDGQGPPARYKHTIRHEFGHALGLQHEHQHPGVQLYDKAKLKVYLRKYKRFRNKDDADLERYIQDQWARITVPEGQISKYDKNSVMHYK